MRFLLEFLRIIFLIIVVGGVLGYMLEGMYAAIGVDTRTYGWMFMIAILILLFVFYRNKLQFDGWYKGKGKEKLTKRTSKILVVLSVSLLLLPPILNIAF
ncbi:hypothetical protein QT711_17730 [Sporosarcina saromensis]|uniref:Uncharacterized protein n=1 Tax=Sporosarcina saromensis TaxID=359365 RepID=A0ABU4GDF2_9BACL|nr:hypothetical protein [Sporosarcina saromensis]MDW0115004.1 hypothetical protein [Sporosarcina saromensis]